MNISKRHLTARIEHSLVTDRVTALMGPRQAGKTTLVRHLLDCKKETRYYNLKDPVVRQMLKENGKQEFEHFRDTTIILDEVQIVPTLLEYIQLQVDKYPENKGQFLLLGSNHLLLNRHIKESLAGRVALFTLLPFSFGELLEKTNDSLFKQLLMTDSVAEVTDTLAQFYLPVNEGVEFQNRFKELDLYGGYPEFITRKDPQDRKDWLINYRQTYLETDLRQLVDLRNTESFEIFEKMFSQRVGNLMNISELGRDCGLNNDTIRRFIGYYRQLFIAWQAKPYHANVAKRMTKMSKYYFFDTGLLRSILGDFSNNAGQFFENTVLAEIKKIFYCDGSRKKLYFSRTATGVEADGHFTSHNGDLSFYIEIKKSERTRIQDIKHLKKYIANQDNSLGLLINNAHGANQLTDKIWSVPAAWLFA